MNERIKELMRESGVKTLFPGDPGAGWQGPKGVSAGLSNTEKLEKFAELIVKECLHIVDDEGAGEGGCIRAMIRIQEQFGVEA